MHGNVRPGNLGWDDGQEWRLAGVDGCEHEIVRMIMDYGRDMYGYEYRDTGWEN